MRIVRSEGAGGLMTAEDVEALLGVDKSTVYRMAQDGRLSAIKVGRQWRFPAAPIRDLLDGAGIPDIRAALPAGAAAPEAGHTQPVVDLAAELLGVMMVVTDMDGSPLTAVANPCPWFAARQDDPAILDACVQDWRVFANEQSFEPRFRVGPHGFECARALIRDGNRLVGMVLAGGIAPQSAIGPSEPAPDDGLYHLTADAKTALLEALPRVASAISRIASRSGSAARST